MANKITDETIDYVGILAKLELSGDEREKAKEDMEKMLDYIDTLNELDTSGIEPMSHVFPVNNVFRDDVVTNGDNHEDTLKNAPVEKEQAFKVPKTVGQKTYSCFDGQYWIYNMGRMNEYEFNEFDGGRAGTKNER